MSRRGSKNGDCRMPGREIDAVVLRAVERVHRGRGHGPFGLVRGLADLLDAAADADHLRRAQRVAEVIVARDGHLAIVAPLLGRAHVIGDGLQLHQRRLLGLFASSTAAPWMSLPMDFSRASTSLRDLRLGVGAERHLDVLLAQQVAQRAVHRRHAARTGAAAVPSRRSGSAARNRSSRFRTPPAAAPRGRAAGGRRSRPSTARWNPPGCVLPICLKKSGWLTFSVSNAGAPMPLK